MFWIFDGFHVMSAATSKMNVMENITPNNKIVTEGHAVRLALPNSLITQLKYKKQLKLNKQII